MGASGIAARQHESINRLDGITQSNEMCQNAATSFRTISAPGLGRVITRRRRYRLAELLEAATGHPRAVMCAETLWWRYHRRIIADYLIAGHHKVFHIFGRPHRASPYPCFPPRTVGNPDLSPRATRRH
jgi:hypothetical protein